MRNHVLTGALLFGGLALAGCGSDNPVQPSTSGEGVSDRPATAELAVTRNTWLIKANMSVNRTDLATATVNNATGQSILYAIGGLRWDPQLQYPVTPVSAVTAYNVATNTWSTRRSLPRPLARTNGAGVLGGKIYVTGGYATSTSYSWRTVFMYNPVTNTWTRKRDMPTVPATWGGIQHPAGAGVTGVISGKLYVVSGCYLEHVEYEGVLLQLCNPLFLRYNQATDQWVTLPAPFPQPIYGPVIDPSIGGVIDGKFYVMARSDGENKAHFAVYDPATNKWTRRTPLGLPRPGAASTVLGGKLYVMGGVRSNETLDITIVYDPVTDAWTRRASLPSPRYDISASKVWLNGQPRIELIGGQMIGGLQVTNNNLQYVP